MDGLSNVEIRRKDDQLEIQLTSDERALIEKAAASLGESLTDFAASTLVREARRITEERELTTLSKRDGECFLGLLDEPPAPNDALRRAAERHAKLIC